MSQTAAHKKQIQRVHNYEKQSPPKRVMRSTYTECNDSKSWIRGFMNKATHAHTYTISEFGWLGRWPGFSDCSWRTFSQAMCANEKSIAGAPKRLASY